MDWKAAYRHLKIINWMTLFILSFISFLISKSSITLGIILGGLVIIANFNVLQHTIRRAFPADGVMQKRRLSIIVKYYLRLLGLGVLIFILVSMQWVHPVGLAIGLSTVVISICSFGIFRAFKTFTSEAV
jgi:hypothetical protein